MPARPYTITADTPLFRGPLIYYGGVLRADGVGVGEAEVRDGNIDGDPLIDYFRAAVSDRDRSIIPMGVYVLRGLFVDLVANVSDFIVWLDLDVPEAVGGPRQGP